MMINEIMTRDPDYVDPNAPVGDVARRMRDGDFGMLPVAENDKLIGIVTDRDLALRVLADNKGADTPVREAMSDKVYYLYDDLAVEQAAQNMAEMAVRRMPVVDRDKNLVGVVSLGDLADKGENKAAGEALEQIAAA